MRTYYAIRTSSVEYSVTGYETPNQRRQLAIIPRAKVQSRKPEDHELRSTDTVYRIRASNINEARQILKEDGWKGRVEFGWHL